MMLKIRHPAVRKVAGLGLSWLMRRWVGTLSVRYRNLTSLDVEPRQGNASGPFLYALWHHDVAVLTAHYGGPHLCALISEHADGRLITEASRHLRMKSVAGSSTRGGIRAVRQMLRQKGHVNLAVTPDGPHGPLHEVKPGVIYLAAKSGLPIVPLGVGYRGAWRLRSWDRLVIPRLAGKVQCVGGEPIHVPADANRAALEAYRLQLQEALDHVHDVAAEMIDPTASREARGEARASEGP